jgi:hypothetical protein
VAGSWPTSTMMWVLAIGGVAAAVWHASNRLRWLPTFPFQVARGIAHKRHLGATIFGGLLGIGWLTIVSTPFVWLGVATAFTSQSILWGAIYGISFGLGRGSVLAREYFGGERDPDVAVARVLSLQGAFSKGLGAVAGLAVGGIGFYLMARPG